MSDEPVTPAPPKPKRARKPKPNGATEVVTAPPPGLPVTAAIEFTEKQVSDLVNIALQATRFGPNPGFLQGQPVELVRAAIVKSMPPEWLEKGAQGWIQQLQDPSFLVLALTYFAAYFNQGYKIGVEHGKHAKQ